MLIACALGLLGGIVAACRFPGGAPRRRNRCSVALRRRAWSSTCCSAAGPSAIGILFTPTAIVIAQSILVLPTVAALSRQFVEDAWQEYREQLTSLGVGALRAVPTLLWDLRYSLVTVGLLGFGRAASEVGAVMIVGGNIDGVTRVMTTTIALETSKGDLPLALGLGIILITVVLALNALAYAMREWSVERHG